jgi:hypothetical protein
MKEKAEETREIAFPEANYSVLAQIASELKVVIPENRDIELAQNFRPRTPGELEPREAWMLSKIMRATTPANISPELIVYLNDRQNANIEELDVPTILTRKRHVAFNNLMSAVEAVHKEAQRIKEQKAQGQSE